MSDARQCGSCSLCCKLPSVRDFNKPIDTWCSHCRPGKGGCSIYADRPNRCRAFVCGWLASDKIPPEWYSWNRRCQLCSFQFSVGPPRSHVRTGWRCRQHNNRTPKSKTT